MSKFEKVQVHDFVRITASWVKEAPCPGIVVEKHDTYVKVQAPTGYQYRLLANEFVVLASYVPPPVEIDVDEALLCSDRS